MKETKELILFEIEVEDVKIKFNHVNTYKYAA